MSNPHDGLDLDDLRDDVREVVLEALGKLERESAGTTRTAVASAIGDVIPNDRGGEDYKADLLVRATDVLERALGVPDRDPRHLDPAGEVADMVESGEWDVKLADDQDADDLREVLEAIEDMDEPEPGDVATARIAREMLRRIEDGESDE